MRGTQLALWLLALSAIGQAWLPPAWSPLRPFEHSLYDQRLRWLAPVQADPQVVIIDIDERALAQHGRWPWPRGLLAELIDTAVAREGASLVGLDLVLAEPDRSSGLKALEDLARGPLRDDSGFRDALQALRPRLDDDGRLAEVLRRHPVVLGFHLSNEPGAARVGALPPALMPVALLGSTGAGLLAWTGHGGNLPPLQQAAALGGGHLNAVIDDDGSVRRLPLLVQHQQGVQPTLAWAMARAVLGGPPQADGSRSLATMRLEPASAPLRALHLQGPGGALSAPVDARAVALVPFAAPGVSFNRHSAADLLADRLPRDALRGRLVLVGVSAPGLIDQRRTPVDEVMLGTLVHAHMLSGLLQGRVLAVPAEAPLIEAALLLLVGSLLAWALPRLALGPGTLLTAALMGLLVAINLLAWRPGATVLPLATSLLLPPLMLALHLLLAFRRATGARQELARLFGQYVPPELVDEMSREPERYSMGSRSAELTVLFADVSGFSAVAERLPPDELGAMMNLLFSHLTDVVRAHRGTLDKYIGDSVMAFWGAPLDDAEHARHAVLAALAMQQRLPLIHAELAAQGWPALQLNIGINTGSMVVGDMGSRHRRAYTVMGDAVNLAARLQAFSSRHGLGLVVGEATRAAMGSQLCLALGRVSVRGRHGDLQAWLPLSWQAGEHPGADRLAADWQRMRDAVDAGRAAEAEALLAALAAVHGDDVALAAPLCHWQRAQWVVAAAAPGMARPSAD
ncbi:MAG: hypothetical protein A3E25_10710 [Burkholderiales bacterium RIFCSPHIGHO2_12_FULL_69_20]|nr:MAG: hypothetical protein A3E25_10710 [Burkholderiales bacterium RIFCSPHIGHO2_12_FULL_69_20]